MGNDEDIIPQSPGGHRSPTRRVLSKANEHEAWQLEAEAQASRSRVNELEQALEESCKRRRQDIAAGQSRARRLANLKIGSAMSDDTYAKPCAQVAALAAGMRAENVRTVYPVLENKSTADAAEDEEDTGLFSLRRRIQESPRPRPQVDSLASALWGSPLPAIDTQLDAQSPRSHGPACTASNLVAENAQLRAQVEELHAAATSRFSSV